MNARLARRTAAHVPSQAETTSSATMTVGPADDAYERQADVMAAQVVARLSADTQAAPLATPTSAAPGIRRSAVVDDRGGLLDEGVSARIDSARGGGRTLPRSVRAGMEQAFGGVDFGSVRVHHGTESNRLNTALGARAFTVGNDIFFGAGAPRLDGAEGQHLLAHELTHTLQDGSSARRTVRRFAVTALTGPGNWAAETTSVDRPPGGLSGGVYILRSNTGSIDSAVVKPIFGTNGAGQKESAEQLVAGDQLLREVLSIRTPDSRIVRGGTPEFQELLSLCLPKSPPKPAPEDDPHDNWRPLTDAQAFVVMSIVPQGKSVAGLAKEALDTGDMRTLHETIAAPHFMQDLGRVVIGDMLIGNTDRLGMGAANLGNIMVGMTGGGGGNLFAIDTTAAMPRTFNPRDFAARAHDGDVQTGQSTKRMLDEGPAPQFKNFIDAVLKQLNGVDNSGNSLRQSSGTSLAYKDVLEEFEQDMLANFSIGWYSALHEVSQYTAKLRAGKARVAADLQNDEVNDEGLLSRAAYMTARAGGEDHAAAIGGLAAANLVAVVRQSTPPATFTAPAALGFKDPGAGIDAEWVGAPSLPAIARLNRYHYTPGRARLSELQEQRAQAANIAAADAEVDQRVSPTKKSFFSRSTEPRNRNLLGKSIVDAHRNLLEVQQNFSAASLATELAEEIVQGVPGTTLDPTQAATVKQAVVGYRDAATRSLDEFGFFALTLDEIASTAGRMRKYPDRDRLKGAAENGSAMLVRHGPFLRNRINALNLAAIRPVPPPKPRSRRA